MSRYNEVQSSIAQIRAVTDDFFMLLAAVEAVLSKTPSSAMYTWLQDHASGEFDPELEEVTKSKVLQMALDRIKS